MSADMQRTGRDVHWAAKVAQKRLHVASKLLGLGNESDEEMKDAV